MKKRELAKLMIAVQLITTCAAPNIYAQELPEATVVAEEAADHAAESLPEAAEENQEETPEVEQMELIAAETETRVEEETAAEEEEELLEGIWPEDNPLTAKEDETSDKAVIEEPDQRPIEAAQEKSIKPTAPPILEDLEKEPEKASETPTKPEAAPAEPTPAAPTPAGPPVESVAEPADDPQDQAPEANPITPAEEQVEIVVLDEAGNEVNRYQCSPAEKERMLQQAAAYTKDGLYTLQVQEHLADGTTKESKSVFTVNQSGTSFQYDEAKSNVRLTKTFTPQIRMENLDEVTVLSCMLNGKAVSYVLEDGALKINEEAIRAGKNRITLDVRDSAGNVSAMKPWEFYIEQPTVEELTVSSKETNSFWKGKIDKILTICKSHIGM